MSQNLLQGLHDLPLGGVRAHPISGSIRLLSLAATSRSPVDAQNLHLVMGTILFGDCGHQ